MQLLKQTFFLLAFSLLLAGCISTGGISGENFISDLRDEDKGIHATYTVFHFSTDSATLYIQLNTNELLFIKQEEDTFRAAFDIGLRMLESFESAVVKDTARQSFLINKTIEGTGERLYTVNFRLPAPGHYVLECRIYDVNKKTAVTDYINIDNSSPQSRQNFFISTPRGLPYLTNYLSAEDSFEVNYRSEAPRTIFVKYYNRQFDLAAPPHSFDVRSQFNYQPDSLFTISTGHGYSYAFPRTGMYHLQLDTSGNEGATIYRFGEGFPLVTTPDALFGPLRYISGRKEFEAMRTAPNRKHATDRFWLQTGGSQERSRELIRRYYTRVVKANRLFTSYTEGWRTDRGMIYIVFGSPHSVYKTSTTESWTYGEVNSALSLTFNFTKEINPFTDNDFVLNRAPIYESSWYRATDTWRQGRIYTDY